jgi:hypothetical protein
MADSRYWSVGEYPGEAGRGSEAEGGRIMTAVPVLEIFSDYV